MTQRKLYAATIVSLVAYQGLRVPEEVLALEVGHVRKNTLLVEQQRARVQRSEADREGPS